MITQETVLLGDFGLQRRDRTTSAGTKSRYTVEIKSEPLVHVYNARALGEGPANAIADHLRTRVQGIAASASPSTQLQRKYAQNALAAGKPWAARRYAGGRIGALAPNQGNGALFNDSGRFAQSIIANPTRDEAWIVNVAANRLDPKTFRDGEAGVVRMVEQLRQHIPEWGDSRAIMNLPAVRQAMALAADMILVNKLGAAYTRNRKLRADIRRGIGSALLRGAQMFGGL